MRKIIHIFLSIIFALLFVSCESKSKRKSDENSNNIPKTHISKNSKLFSVESKNKTGNLKILTWNIQDLGKSKNIQEIYQIAQVIKDFDVVAIQEVVAIDPKGAQAVAKIADELNRMGYKWDYSISDPTNSPSSNISERYAFLWKASKLKLVSKPFLDSKLESVINREPYIAEFKLKKDSESFYLITIHAKVFNDKPEEEIIYFQEYPKRLQTENIVILGDFNLNEKHSVWDNLYQIGFKSSIQNAPTTLKRKCKKGKYLNYSIDNIYYNTSNIELINSGRIDFVNDCKNLKRARFLSDHLPVFLECKMN